MSEYVDEFLADRVKEGGAFDGSEVVQLIVDRYSEALNRRNWPATKALGQLMLELAKPFKDHPDYRGDWQP
ncbi:hypothetical protein [Streptomyces sp. BPTC-684]|uniref:hypothetical protein n=1 Tax=Streptomyces sp. BPTC-684 TaxID=3043734 RepID=UPI0024B099FB|nr:hypothetical protein [Streptomyces sp. BPTC-684]WHM35704.1 hypothetical protein QIY60_01480 [Streptomyces sp. BPTC-684]